MKTLRFSRLIRLKLALWSYAKQNMNGTSRWEMSTDKFE